MKDTKIQEEITFKEANERANEEMGKQFFLWLLLVIITMSVFVIK